MRMRFAVFFVIVATLMGCFSAIAPARALTFPEKPSPQDFFVDKANLIKEPDRKAVNDIARALWTEQHIPLYVVTVDSLASYGASALGADRYAAELFDHWGIGAQNRNYGILLFVAAGDRKARIEFGGGFAHQHDAAAEDVMQSLIVPAFQRGDASTGIVDGVRGLDAVARGLQLPMPKPPTWFWPVVIIGGILFVMMIVNLFRTGRTGWAWGLLAALGAILLFAAFAGRRGGGSGGGFGGGSSGGGGASGSW